jgi:hypothetical protein
MFRGPMFFSNKLFKQWLRHREIEKDEVRVYRPSNYKFPYSRGREGFEIKENGEFLSYDIAPGCGLEETRGNWEEFGKDKIKIIFSEQQKDYVLKILSCEDDILKVRKE